MKVIKKIKYPPLFNLMGLMALTFCLASCDDYLNIKPKKQEIPSTLEDYISFFNEEYMLYTAHVYPNMSISMLLGEYYYAYINYYSETDLDYIVYYWTDGDRYAHQTYSSDFAYCYRGIAVANQIIDGAKRAEDCDEADRQSAIASARILRVMKLYHACQMYADAYNPDTAADKLSIPLILSSEADASYTQPSLKDLYEFFITELSQAVECESLPDNGATILTPGKGAGYAMLARIYLTIWDYENALKAAEKALAINNALFDWTKYYADNYNDYFENWTYTKMLPSAMEYDFCENYYFGHGTMSSATWIHHMPTPAGETFEPGDCFFKCNWILEPWYGGTYYHATSSGFYNFGGLRSVEQYFIKAECQARLGDLSNACITLNSVREKLIDPEIYTPFNSNSIDETVMKIRDQKHSTLMGTVIPFADAKRFNSEGKYPVIPKKIINGEVRYLQPSDRLWIFPFAIDLMENQGNGTVTQNVDN